GARRRGVMARAGLDLAHEDGVVATGIGVDGGALEVSQRPVQDGQPEDAGRASAALDLLGGARALGGEAVGQRLLALAEYVHREPIRVSQRLIALRVLRHANQDHGGGERHGREGAGGEPGRATLRISGGHHGHAAGEVAEQTPEIIGADHVAFLAGPGGFFNFIGGLDGISGPRCLDAPGASPYTRPRSASSRSALHRSPCAESPGVGTMTHGAARSVTEAAVLGALREVKDPDGGKDVVTLGLVQDLRIAGSEVSFTLAFSGQSPQSKVALHSGASKAVGQLPGVGRVSVKMGAGAAPHAHAHGAQPARPAAPAGPAARSPEFIPEVKHTVAVSSGKGGVGKSTVAVNLALALHQSGVSTGLVDVDVYGPDVPLMMGAKGRPGMFDNRIIPVEVHGVKIMSTGLLVDEREALVWRGPMIHSAVQQFLRDVAWGALDYLVFDMPPGTGDAQLSLSQIIPLSGVVMVTTPQDVALLHRRQGPGHVPQAKCPHPGRGGEHELLRGPRHRDPLRHLRRGRGGPRGR